MSNKLTVEDMRDTEAAFERGVRSTEERLGDGAVTLRKHEFLTTEHDTIEAGLRKWLTSDTHGIRPPGVKDNLFRLSDYLCGRLPVPPESTLLFLHAYIFALEGAHYHAQQELRRVRKAKPPFPRRVKRATPRKS